MQHEQQKKWILNEIDKIDCQLSPENLFCDGEISHAQGMARAAKLNQKRKELEKMLGEKVEYKG